MNFESRLQVCALQIRTLIWTLLGNQYQGHRQVYLDSLITEMETSIDEMMRTLDNETIDEDSIKEKLIIKKLFPIYWGLKDMSIEDLAN